MAPVSYEDMCITAKKLNIDDQVLDCVIVLYRPVCEQAYIITAKILHQH